MEEGLGHMVGQDLDEDRSGKGQHRADGEGVDGSLVGSEDLDNSYSCKDRRPEDVGVAVAGHHDVEVWLEVVAVVCELEDD